MLTTYERTGNLEAYEDIKAELETARKRNPFVYVSLAVRAYQRGEYDVCIDYLENALNFNPLMIEVHYWLGRVFYETGNLEDSYSSWEKVLEIDKQYPKVNYFLNKGGFFKFG